MLHQSFDQVGADHLEKTEEEKNTKDLVKKQGANLGSDFELDKIQDKYKKRREKVDGLKKRSKKRKSQKKETRGEKM